MKKELKGFICGILITVIIMSTVTYAAGVQQKIDVMLNSVNLKVNGKIVNADNILYKGTTYVPLRAVGEMLGKEVGWDQKSNTASINDKGFVDTTISEKTSGINDFRNVKWGMTLEEVKKNENAEYFGGMENVIMYKTKAMNMDATLVYQFNDKGQLCQAMYMLDKVYTNKNSYIEDYLLVKNDLISKYGNPTDDAVLWLNDLFKDDYQDWGLAVSVGHLRYQTKWYTDNTEIDNLLTGNDYKIDLAISYKSRNIEPPKIKSGL